MARAVGGAEARAATAARWHDPTAATGETAATAGEEPDATAAATDKGGAAGEGREEREVLC